MLGGLSSGNKNTDEMDTSNVLKSPSNHELNASTDDTDNDDVFVDVRCDINEDYPSEWSSKPDEEHSYASSIAQSLDVSPTGTVSQDAPSQSVSSPEVNPTTISLDDVLNSEKEFIEYVMSLPSGNGEESSRPKSRKTSTKHANKSGGSGNKVGLDHLDNLCKLMEQLSELREANSKLHRRVQYLEDLKSLHQMHKEVNKSSYYNSDNVLSHKFESPDKKTVQLDYICLESQEVVERPYSRNKERRYVVHKSKTQVNISRTQAGRTRERSKSVGHEEICDTKTKRIFPKWFKVKGASKSDKSYPRVGGDYCSDRKNRMREDRLIHSDKAGILRVPMGSDDFNRDDDDSLTGDFYRVSAGYSPITHSSLEEIRDSTTETPKRGKWKSQSVYVSEKHSLELPQDQLQRRKTPSPHSHSRDIMLDGHQKSLTLERDIDPEQIFSKYEKEEMKKSNKSPWGRVKTIIQSRKDSLRRRQRLNGANKRSEGDINTEISSVAENCENSPRNDHTSNRQYLESSESSLNLSTELKNLDSCDQKDRKQKPKPLRLPSPTGEDRLGSYNEVDKELRTPSSSPSYQQTDCPDVTQSRCSNRDDHSLSHRKLVASASAPVVDIMEELQRNLSEDFSRKIREWEKIRSGIPKVSSPKFERKGSGIKNRKANKDKNKLDRQEKSSKHKMKDLNWLEKELQKIEKEKTRLAKEKQKYEERAIRLERLRDTVLSARTAKKKEILVKTSAGEFRFEGISDAFTKKLYEWETKLGVGPELSTLALLDASFKTSGGDKLINLQRGLSKSESSVIDASQQSHNSSNSLPSLKPEDLTVDRAQPSRANSEPDLSSYGQQKELPARFQSGDVLCNIKTYSPPEVTQLIDSDSEERLTGKRGEQHGNQDDNYYSLLEENVILLEQLKNKEDICRRLEKELGNLDKKMTEMNIRHQEDLEKYKEKLWEIHGPRNKPRDLQGCLRMLSKLKRRIEELDRCGEKLKSDRNALEESFRYHTQQQAQMTVDLIGKMKELKQAHFSNSNCAKVNSYNANEEVAIFDSENVNRLYHLSTELLKQTQNLEQALADRTRQICHLRWELLHRDVAALRLHTELHRVRWQGGGAAAKRAKFAERRSLSSSERLFPWEKENETRQQLPERLLKQSSIEYGDWNNVNFETKDLTSTVHELNKELLKLSSTAEGILRMEDSTAGPVLSDSSIKNQEDVPTKMRCSSAENDSTSIAVKCDTGQIKVRRNSADNISSLSETSSLNDGDRIVRTVHCSQKKSGVSSSSESFGMDEELFNKVSIEVNRGQKHPVFEDSSQQMILQYPVKCVDENETNKNAPTRFVPKHKYNYYQNSKPSKEHKCDNKIHSLDESKGTLNLNIPKEASVESSSKSDLNQFVPIQKERLISRSRSSDYPHSNLINGKIENGNDESLRIDSPIIRSRSPRKLKREFSCDRSVTTFENGCIKLQKSISHPECQTKHTYIKRQGAPNVRGLIERYNKKLSEQSSKTSPHPVRKTSRDNDQQSLINVTVRIETQNRPLSPSHERVQTLNKAKEEFIKRNSYIDYSSPVNTANVTENHDQPNSPEIKYLYPDNDNLSTNSAVSTDSVNLVLCRSAESCRESRLARRSLAERTLSPSEETTPPTTPTSPDIKPVGKSGTHFLNFKLRKSKKKKELSSISELCRQSLFLNLDKTNKNEDDKSPAVSPQSCPSSPDLKPKPTKTKSNWLHKTIFKQTQ